MKIALDTVITDIKGEPIKNEAEEAVTARSLCLECVLTPLRGDENLTGKQKADLFALALTLQNPETEDLKVEDIVTLKERVGRAFTVLIVGRLYEVLEGSKETGD